MISPEDLVAHMRAVLAAERDLRDLAVVWQMIESSAAISCPDEVAPILPTLMSTRARFDDLQARLVTQMVLENEAELADEIGAQAQCAIDILVRNLYERTADVGFLATDDVVRDFCAQAEPAAERRAAMVARLAEYQAKYTVYDDVILLSPAGAVLARLDATATLERSSDSVVAEALAADAYVERFRSSDLGHGSDPALLYAHRITQPDGRALGVLVLRFRFADEMQRIFDSISDDKQQLALVLIDEQRRVVSTNDPAHVPPGAVLAAVPDTGIELSLFAGREYLTVCRASAGYQGYRGPAWRAQAMVSLTSAFRQRTQDDGRNDQVPLDNATLVAINEDADAINRELRRVVWNGRLMAGENSGDRSRLKAVLKQINHAGMRTRERVGVAIQSICRTSLARARQQTRELARLAADIMDRNLYERANDCRWWALSPVLRRVLAAPASAEGSAEMCRVLDHINGLYTVYGRLAVFDTQGKVRAASRCADGDGVIGSTVPAEWQQAVAQLGDSQRYAVSPFETTTLSDQGPTYVYLAAVRADDSSPAGGIAIVFNSAKELGAMLRDVMADRQGSAAFVDAQGRVLAATDTALAAALVPAFTGGEGLAEHDGAHYACARVAAGGYREFKVDDGYDNGVAVVVALRLGSSDRRRPDLEGLSLNTPPTSTRMATQEVAVFQVGGTRYALPAADVMEAVSRDGLVRTPSAGGAVLGMIEVSAASGSRLVQVVCARRLFGVDYPARATDGVLLVLRSVHDAGVPALALRVDDVLTVLDVPAERLHAAPQGFGRFAPWVAGIIDCQTAGSDGGVVLVQLLDSRQIAAATLPGAGRHAEATASDKPGLLVSA